MNFGNITLRQVPFSTNLTFRHKYKLLESQQYLLENLWIVRTSHEKIKALNALSCYFNQVNEKLDSKNFSFYLIINGKQLDIYNYWPHILQQIESYPNPHYKGF